MSNSRESRGKNVSTVADTCNRFSRYLNQRGSVSGLNLAGLIFEPKGTETSKSAIKGKALLDEIEISEEKPATNGLMDLFPQHAGVSCPKHITDNAISSKQGIMENEASLMTISYGGKSFVFNNFPVEKVKDVMEFAMQKSQSNTDRYDLPIMRQASLQRFMKERKERAAARAPYKVQGSKLASSSNKEDELSLKL